MLSKLASTIPYDKKKKKRKIIPMVKGKGKRRGAAFQKA